MNITVALFMPLHCTYISSISADDYFASSMLLWNVCSMPYSYCPFWRYKNSQLLSVECEISKKLCFLLIKFARYSILNCLFSFRFSWLFPFSLFFPSLFAPFLLTLPFSSILSFPLCTKPTLPFSSIVSYLFAPNINSTADCLSHFLHTEVVRPDHVIQKK